MFDLAPTASHKFCVDIGDKKWCQLETSSVFLNTGNSVPSATEYK